MDGDDPKTRIFEELTLAAPPGVAPVRSSLAPAAFAVEASRVKEIEKIRLRLNIIESSPL